MNNKTCHLHKGEEVDTSSIAEEVATEAEVVATEAEVIVDSSTTKDDLIKNK